MNSHPLLLKLKEVTLLLGDVPLMTVVSVRSKGNSQKRKVPVVPRSTRVSADSGSEAGSYPRLKDFAYHSTLGLRVIKRESESAPDAAMR